MLAIASRMSNALCKPGSLHHEAYIALYSQALTLCIIPLFILANPKSGDYTDQPNDNKVGKPTDNCDPQTSNCEVVVRDTSTITMFEKYSLLALLFLMLFIKVCFLDRNLMKRFTEEYEEQTHSLPNWIGKWFDQESSDSHAVLQEMTVTQSSTQVDEEANQLPEHRRGRINISVFSVQILFLVYWISYELGMGVDDRKEQPTLNLWSAVVLVFCVAKLSGTLTYWDDLEMIY